MRKELNSGMTLETHDQMKSKGTLKMIKLIDIKINPIDIALIIFIFLKTGVIKSNEIIEILSLITFIFFSFLKIIKTKKLIITKQIMLYGLFTIFCCLSYYWAINRQYTLKPSMTVIALLFFLVALSNYMSKKEDLINVIKYVVISNVIVSLKILFFYWIYEGSAAGRIKSITGIYFNTVGQVIGFSILFSIYLYKYYGDKKYLLFSAPQFMAVILTTSRKSILIPVVGVFLILFFERKMLEILKYVLIIFLAFFLLNLINPNFFGTIILKFSEFSKYFRGIQTNDSSINLRMFFIKTGKEIFTTHPVFGIGINNFSYYVVNYTSYIEPRYSHNNYIELISGLGIVGLFLYYSSYIYILFKTIYLKRKNKDNIFLIITLSIILDLIIMEWGIVSYSGCLYHTFIMLIYYTATYQKELFLKAKEKHVR